jgi:hypothetical protein
VTGHFPMRCFAFDQFGPLSIRPCHGSAWAFESAPLRLPATYHRTHGIRYFHGCYSLGEDQLWGVNRRRKGGDHSLAALKSIRAARPDGAPIYVIMDNLSANKTPAIRAWAARHKVELCLTPTYASWANPIEAQFGPLRTFTMGASDHPIIRRWRASCRRICAGATPTPATPTSSRRNAANEPAFAANATNAGVGPERHNPVNVHGQRTSRSCGAAAPSTSRPADRARSRTVIRSWWRVSTAAPRSRAARRVPGSGTPRAGPFGSAFAGGAVVVQS